VVDQDTAHGGGSEGEKVGAILPFDPTKAEQSDEGFVDQCRRLKRMAAPFVAEQASRDAS